jgi:hypothetical protein
MPIKKPHTLRKLDETEAAQLDQNFDQLYKTKLESRSHRNSSGAQKSIYQVAEHGLVGFSATGSATVAKTFSLGARILDPCDRAHHGRHGYERHDRVSNRLRNRRFLGCNDGVYHGGVPSYRELSLTLRAFGAGSSMVWPFVHIPRTSQ